ncbi:MAG: RNA-binding protein [Firmicutes bacterium GWF2_51_9]|jgi:RNA-binding protein|nr:YhbY family RNA-binding protein [Erysipelotrichaceae bacterium]OGS54194.1 MAG: RNA-binding protein [Firmicutes bacterium GWF2_51_9]OGS58085.1 MAG: RNA-binding protein [Firmicutes bacterium GWE2_51_13]HAM63262.1 ribosome assembly RNA-binding protein YhbY [Erysipelotrichaceae bacterium]HAO60654.1 ribosome assembly RNA-binding protein YhbY [Erysipelotrichaceae bacterium]
MLNSKQKSALRSLGQTRRALFQVGKEGMSLNLVNTVGDSLEAHELIKISVLKSCPVPVNEIALDLSSSTHSEIVQIIGKTILLYRQSEKKKIELPR